MNSGMSGSELAGRVQESFPSAEVVLMAPCLEEPFTAAALVERVQQVLAESRRVAKTLQASLETSFKLQREIESACSGSRAAVRQSRGGRSERCCARLRAADAIVPSVLVAENDAAFRYAVCRFLAHRGFTVLQAPDGLDMLVTDIRMPGLDGLELAKTLAAERPRARIVFMTAECMDLPHPAVRKPFELEDLLGTMIDAFLTGQVGQR